jgi:hypothetical protein
VFTFSNFVAPPIVGLIGAKWSMVLGALCYAVFMATFLFLREWLLYITSGVLGFGAASKMPSLCLIRSYPIIF